MRKAYITTKLVEAEPGPAPRDMGDHPRGTPGMIVYYPDGYTSWSPSDVFAACSRELQVRERQLLEQTDAEASIARISDGDPDAAPDPTFCPKHPTAKHHFEHNLALDQWRCVCGKTLDELRSAE